jgi:hypothetical protein
MRAMLIALSILVAFAIGSYAKAQNYPWCPHYSYRDGVTCGFTTFDQCMATISGIGGFCEANTQYRPALSSFARRHGYGHYP